MKMGSVGDSLFAGAPSSSPHEVFAQTGTNSLSWKKGARINFVAVLPDSPPILEKNSLSMWPTSFFFLRNHFYSTRPLSSRKRKLTRILI
jgi:hypothetical protein